MAMPKCTVSQYLIARLKEIGAEHVFAVPGDYAGPFVSAIDRRSGHHRVAPRMIRAGRGDAYARLRGAGACA